MSGATLNLHPALSSVQAGPYGLACSGRVSSHWTSGSAAMADGASAYGFWP